jgi:hypothetical protein
MPGLMARILSRRANGAPHPAPSTTAAESADQPTVAVPAAGETEASAPAEPEQATAVIPVVDEPAAEPPAAEAAAPAEAIAPADDAAADLPAGAEPVAPTTPSFRDRGKLRRRLRYLRRVRELGFRDLGGLVFDLDRFGRERPDLVRIKLDGLTAIDGELRTLELALDDVRAVEELQEPGIAACATCGALHGSEARFCPACGTAVDAPPPATELPATAPETAAAPEADAAPEQPAA